MATNQEIAAALRELARLTTLAEGSPQAFRVRAYESAASSVESATVPVASMSDADLTDLRGVGKATASKIREFVETGRIARLDRLREEFPLEFRELTRVPGIGPKKAVLLRDRLGVESVDDLRAALERHDVAGLPGFGRKTEENLARSLEKLGPTGKDRRTPIGDAMRLATRVASALEGIPGVRRAEPMGSLRRFRETIGDIDVIAVATVDPREVMERFVGLPVVAEVVAYGARKSAILGHDGVQIDLRVVEPHQWGSAAMYFTGSKAHNIRLRQIALEDGRSLSEYGLADTDTGDVVASATEEEVYRALGMQWVPPEIREDRGEVELARRGALPRFLEESDLRGDLHVHTDLSGDGREPLEKMVEAASALGYEYVAVTDHGEDLSVNGVSREELIAQRQAIDGLRAGYPDMQILHGCELNIGPAGGVDYDSGFRAGLQWGVAGVHSGFDLDQDAQTRRVVAAMEHPGVNAIAHLTGRRIGRRPGIDLDLDAVFDAAEATGTALEINGNLDRLDVPAEILYAARDREVLFVVSTDAHVAAELANVRWGVRNARRGWVDPDRVVNTWPAPRFLEWVRRKRRS